RTMIDPAPTSTSRSRSWGMSSAPGSRGARLAGSLSASPGGRWRRAQADRAGDPPLAPAPSLGQDPHRPRRRDQRDRAGVDQLLRALLPLAADPASQKRSTSIS